MLVAVTAFFRNIASIGYSLHSVNYKPFRNTSSPLYTHISPASRTLHTAWFSSPVVLYGPPVRAFARLPRPRRPLPRFTSGEGARP